MYLPAHFAQSDREALFGLIEAHPLGTLVTQSAEGLDANPFPFHVEAAQGAHGTLIAHCARANPVWQQVPAGAEVMVLFQGGDAYLSPNWYPSKHEKHEQVPTWNYRVVNVHGRIRFHDDEKFVRSVVARLTRTHEGCTPDNTPWKMTDSAPEYISARLASIIGIEIEITRLEGKWKLSQNREARDRLGAADALAARGERIVSDAMRNA